MSRSTAALGTLASVLLSLCPLSSALAFTRPATPPTPGGAESLAGEVIVQQVTYDAAGHTRDVIDNTGKVTRTFYDAMGRTTYVVENHQQFDPASGDNSGVGAVDADRTTKYVYDAGSNVTQQIVLDPNGDGSSSDQQITKYVYSAELTDKGSPLPLNSYLRAIIYPDSSSSVSSGQLTGSDLISFTYYADGTLHTRTDQRGVTLTYAYDLSGRLYSQTVTAGTVAGDQRITTTYDVQGRTDRVATYSDAAGNTVTSDIRYVYDGFGRLTTEYQDHDSYVATSGTGESADSGTPRITYAYTTSGGGGALQTVTYPNGRQIHLLYDDTQGIDAALMRPTALSNDSTRGTDDANVITNYARMGSGRVVRKTYPTIAVRRDFVDESGEGSDANNPYDASFDRFGRVIRNQWETYDAYGAAVSQKFQIAHTYDAASNRTFDKRYVYGGYSNAFTFDDLHRLETYKRASWSPNSGVVGGKDYGDQDFLDDTANWTSWVRQYRKYEYDQLGNKLFVDTETVGDASAGTFNQANELLTQTQKGQATSSTYRIGLSDVYESNGGYENVGIHADSGSSDAYEIIDGVLHPTSISADTFDGHTEEEPRLILLYGEDTGPISVRYDFLFYSTPPREDVGTVFGYKNPNDYYIACYNRELARFSCYHVVDGHKTLINYVLSWLSPNITKDTGWAAYRRGGGLSGRTDIPGEVPSGRIGLYFSITTAEISNFYFRPSDTDYIFCPQWATISPGVGGNSYMVLVKNSSGWLDNPAVATNQWLSREFDITVALKWRGNAIGMSADFRAKSLVQWDRSNLLSIRFTPNTALAPTAPWNDATGSYAAPPTPLSTDMLWTRARFDGTYFRIKQMIKNDGAPLDSEWPGGDDWSDQYLVARSTAEAATLDQTLFSLVTGGPHSCDVHAVILRRYADTDGDGSPDAWVTDYQDSFHYLTYFLNRDTPEFDAAGNQTFDPRGFAYTYDAWNRLVAVNYAYRDEDGTNQVIVGSPAQTLAYDGTHRRIVDTTTNVGGKFARKQHIYYVGQSQAEIRNGSDQVVTQYVWSSLAGNYIDELCQIIHNGDPATDPNMDLPIPSGGDPRIFFAAQDVQYNMLGVLLGNAQDQFPNHVPGDVIERYEYTPYGDRTVYISAGANDPDCHTPLAYSQRIQDASELDTPVALCNVNFQGLFHDEVTGLDNNRARIYNPHPAGGGRFLQRDPLGYPDGMNSYAAYHVMRQGVDPRGRYNLIDVDWGWLGAWKVSLGRNGLTSQSRSVGYLLEGTAGVSLDGSVSATVAQPHTGLSAAVGVPSPIRMGNGYRKNKTSVPWPSLTTSPTGDWNLLAPGAPLSCIYAAYCTKGQGNVAGVNLSGSGNWVTLGGSLGLQALVLCDQEKICLYAFGGGGLTVGSPGGSVNAGGFLGTNIRKPNDYAGYFENLGFQAMVPAAGPIGLGGYVDTSSIATNGEFGDLNESILPWGKAPNQAWGANAPTTYGAGLSVGTPGVSGSAHRQYYILLGCVDLKK